MTYRVVMIVRSKVGEEFTITTRVAGCADAEQAKEKAADFYRPAHVVKFKKVEAVE